MFIKDPGSFEDSDQVILYVSANALGPPCSPVTVSLSGNRILFGPGITTTTGKAHRKQRKLLNPAFSPTHLRELTPVFFNVAETVSVSPT